MCSTCRDVLLIITDSFSVKGLPLAKEWCTDIHSTKITYSCKELCKELGQILCAGKLVHYKHKEKKIEDTDDFKNCCCDSKCDPSMKLTCLTEEKGSSVVHKQSKIYNLP